MDQWRNNQKPNTKTIAESVVYLRGLWLEGSVGNKKKSEGFWAPRGARAEGIGAPEERGAGKDEKK